MGRGSVRRILRFSLFFFFFLNHFFGRVKKPHNVSGSMGLRTILLISSFLSWGEPRQPEQKKKSRVFTGHGPTRGSDQEAFKKTRGSSRVGSERKCWKSHSRGGSSGAGLGGFQISRVTLTPSDPRKARKNGQKNAINSSPYRKREPRQPEKKNGQKKVLRNTIVARVIAMMSSSLAVI